MVQRMESMRLELVQAQQQPAAAVEASVGRAAAVAPVPAHLPVVVELVLVADIARTETTVAAPETADSAVD